MASNRDMIQAFVTGELSDADHDLMAHHISTCRECAAAVAAERVVRVEMARLTASEDTPPVPAATFAEPPAAGSPTLPADSVVLTSEEATGADSVPVSAGADMLSEQVVQSGDLSVPPVPELQLDFVLDRTSEGDGMLLPRESVREVALDQLPPAPVHSVRRTQPAGEDQEEAAEVESARVIYADDMEVAAATMAGISVSVAHAAAALASNGPAGPLEAEVEEPMPVEAATETLQPEPMPTEVTTETTEPGPIPVEAATATEEAEPPAIEEMAIVDRAEPLVVEEAPVVEVSEPTAIEDAAIIEEQEPVVLQDAAIVEEQAPPVTQDADAGAEVDEPQGSQTGSAVIVVPRISATPPRSGRLWRWSAAAGLLVVAVVAAYAATQVRSSTLANAANTTDASDPLEMVSDPEVEWQTTPSVLTPILDSAVYSRVLDVTLGTDSLADSLDAAVGYDPFAGGDTTALPGAAASVPTVPRSRRARTPERLPQIVSDPPDANGTQARQPGSETLPEVVTGNAPASTTARGSAVVISGVPDVPRLLRTTTHRPQPDVAYVLREYDASAAEPAPRAGVNEYRWSDATGSRLYVLSGPVDVTELRAYARRLQSRGR